MAVAGLGLEIAQSGNRCRRSYAGTSFMCRVTVRQLFGVSNVALVHGAGQADMSFLSVMLRMEAENVPG